MAYLLQGTAPMVANGNTNANNRPIGPDGKREWSFGLFDCFARCNLCVYQNWSNFVHRLNLNYPFSHFARRLLVCLLPVCRIWQEQTAPAQFATAGRSVARWR